MTRNQSGARDLRVALGRGSSIAGLLLISATAAQAQAIPQGQSSTDNLVVAQSTPQAGSSGSTGGTVEEMTIIGKRLLVKDEDIATAATSVTLPDIQAVGVTTGSLELLLKETPSVTAYTQGIGQNEPTLAIRGQNEQGLSQTVNGVPFNGLFGNVGGYLTTFGGLGAPVTLNEISSTEVFAGVAPPDKQGFGTVGGTIAYVTKEATDDRYYQLNVGGGSFSTTHEGFEINTGKLWDDVDAPMVFVLYDQSYTGSYIDYTPAHYRNIMVNVIKPYDGGNSKVELTVIDNQGTGYVQDEPTPTPLQATGGFYYNKPYSDGYYKENNNYITAILRDVTPINTDLIFDGSVFFQQTTQQVSSYESLADLGTTYPANIQVPAFFYPCPAQGATYNPAAVFGSAPEAGCNALVQPTQNQTIGFSSKVSYFWDTDWAHQNFSFGTLIGQSRLTDAIYEYGSIPMPEIWAYNGAQYGLMQQRFVVSGYAQDKIDLMDDKLHLLPGFRLETAYSSAHENEYGGFYTPHFITNYTREAEPYIGVSYNLPYDMTAYANAGKGSLFAPITDYQIGTNGLKNTPRPEEVYLIEAGLKYNTSTLFLGADWYYQRVKKGFSFFADFITGVTEYGNQSAEQFRGVEFSGKWKITPTITIFGNGSYNQATYLATAPSFDTLAGDQYGYAFEGTPLSNVPKFLGNLGVDYDNNGIFARFWAQYTGSEYITQDLTTGPACAPATYNPNLCGITYTDLGQKNPANVIFNILGSYTWNMTSGPLKSIKLSLNIQNVLDKKYYTYFYSAENPSPGGLYGVEPAFTNGLVGQPRTFIADLSLRF